MGEKLSEWIKYSQGILHIEALLFPEVQGLGIIEIELLEEFPKIKLSIEKTPEELAQLAKHILLSKLWILGAYEIIRVIKKITVEKNYLKSETKEKIKEYFTEINRLRVPLAKFEKSGNGKERLYSGIPDSFVDKEKGVGWNIYEERNKEIKQLSFYRKEMANKFLYLLKLINEDIHSNFIL